MAGPVYKQMYNKMSLLDVTYLLQFTNDVKLRYYRKKLGVACMINI